MEPFSEQHMCIYTLRKKPVRTTHRWKCELRQSTGMLKKKLINAYRSSVNNTIPYLFCDLFKKGAEHIYIKDLYL